MQFGILFELQTSDPVNGEAAVWREGLEQAELADRSGFDAVWALEHHFLVGYAHCSAPEVFLTAVSQRTTNVRLGHGVVVAPTPVNHPLRPAERVAALDLVSGRSGGPEDWSQFGEAPFFLSGVRLSPGENRTSGLR